MSRAAWDALAIELKREVDGRCYVVDPAGFAPDVLVQFTARPDATPRPDADEVYTLQRELSR